MMTEINGIHYTERLEYHGNTTVARIRSHGTTTLAREWIIFDSVEDAEAFFIDHCHDPADDLPLQ